MPGPNLIGLLFGAQSLPRRSARSRMRTTPDEREILSGYRYEQRRREILRRDDFRCVLCGSPHEVAVHHRRKRSLGRDDRVANLVTLCASCHRAEHE
jgi:5-methylcytosine-specific restriction endonuclease McrA